MFVSCSAGSFVMNVFFKLLIFVSFFAVFIFCVTFPFVVLVVFPVFPVFVVPGLLWMFFGFLRFFRLFLILFFVVSGVYFPVYPV